MKSSIFDINESPASEQIVPVSRLKHCIWRILSLWKTDSDFLLSAMPCIALLFCNRLKNLSWQQLLNFVLSDWEIHISPGCLTTTHAGPLMSPQVVPSPSREMSATSMASRPCVIFAEYSVNRCLDSKAVEQVAHLIRLLWQIGFIVNVTQSRIAWQGSSYGGCLEEVDLWCVCCGGGTLDYTSRCGKAQPESRWCHGLSWCPGL